jgi:hypothetical protein
LSVFRLLGLVVSWFLVFGFWFLVFGFWFLVFGFWFLVFGFWFFFWFRGFRGFRMLVFEFCGFRGFRGFRYFIGDERRKEKKSSSTIPISIFYTQPQRGLLTFRRFVEEEGTIPSNSLVRQPASPRVWKKKSSIHHHQVREPSVTNFRTAPSSGGRFQLLAARVSTVPS